MINPLDKILTEWAYRVHNGMPDPSDNYHMVQLDEYLTELRVPRRFREALLNRMRGLKEDDLVKKKKGDDKKPYLVKKFNPDRGQVLIKKDAKSKDADKPEKIKSKEELAVEKQKRDKENEATSKQVRDELYGGEEGVLLDGSDEVPKTDEELANITSDGHIKQMSLRNGYPKKKKGIIDRITGFLFKAAPGNAGSMFNEIISGEGTSILDRYPGLDDQQLARVLYDQFCGTTLGGQVKGNDLDTGVSVSDIPSGVDRSCYSKCLVTARSSKRKQKRKEEAINEAQKNGFGKPVKTHNFYGHSHSIKAQVNTIKNALKNGKKVYAPDGTEITDIEELICCLNEGDGPPPECDIKPEDWKRLSYDQRASHSCQGIYKAIESGGGGDNPSDTGTFAEDEDGNLVLMFTSDKMTTGDQQANSTLISEILNRHKTLQRIKEGKTKTEMSIEEGQTTPDGKTAEEEIENHKDKVDKEQNKLKKIVAPVGEQMMEDADKNHPQATDDFIEDWESNENTKGHWDIWLKAMMKDNGWEEPLSQEQKRCAARLLMKVTANEADRPIDPKTEKPQRSNPPDVAVSPKAGSGVAECKTKTWLSNDMAKISARSAERQHTAGKRGYDVKEHIENVRKNIIYMERNHLNNLNNIKVKVKDPETGKFIYKGLGTVVEAQQIVDQLHLVMMDDDAKGLLGNGLMEVNAGGNPINKETLRKCIGESTSGDVVADFVVGAPDTDNPADRFTWNCPLPGKKKTKATSPTYNKNGEIEDAGMCPNGSPRRATGRVMFIYAITKDGKKVRIAQKNMRTKTGDLGNYDTTVVYSPEMQKCFAGEEE